jgi:hypothetical protein
MVEISKRFLDQCQMKDSQCFKFTLGREPFKFINSYSKKTVANLCKVWFNITEKAAFSCRTTKNKP